MNVYDFDKTIYHNDCTVDFYFYELRKHPFLMRYLPIQIFGWLGYFLKMHDKTKMKNYFYKYLKGIKNIDEEVTEFWNKHIKLMHKWYFNQQKEDDMVISASAFFMVKPACERLGIKNVIASPVDQYQGEVTGKNCHGAQKAIVFKEAGYDKIDKFYSDSYSDQPLADLAAESYLVKGERLVPWKKRV